MHSRVHKCVHLRVVHGSSKRSPGRYTHVMRENACMVSIREAGKIGKSPVTHFPILLGSISRGKIT